METRRVVNRRRYLLALACVGVTLTARPAAAQATCQASESVNACIERLAGTATAETKAALAREQADVRKKTETGLADIKGLNSSVKDFLPLLQMSGLVGDVKKEDTTGTVSVTLNTRFLGAGGLTDDPSLQLKAVFDTRPKLFDQLKSRLPAATRDATERALIGGETGAEHTTLHASYNVTSDRLGRNFARHMRLYNDLFEEAVAGPVSALAQAEAALVRKLIGAMGDVSLDDTPWARIPAATQTAATPIIREIVSAHQALQAAFAESVKTTGLDLFGQLVNNQPQLTISGSRGFRDDLFGPDLVTGRVAFEMGLSGNLNGVFGRIDPRQCRAQRAECLDRYASYAKRPETLANLKAASRLAVYAELIHHQDYRYTNAEAALDVAFPSGTEVSAGLDYGTLFGVGEAGAADGRVDASLRFERRSAAPDATRLVASVVLTRKVGDLSLPFGIVYANKPRFLTGVNKGLTANIGLKFSLFPGAK